MKPERLQKRMLNYTQRGRRDIGRQRL